MTRDKQRTVTFLSRRQVDFLDKLGKDALFSQGSKLSRSEALSELVNFLMQLGINAKNVNFSKYSLSETLLKLIEESQVEGKK